MLTVDKIKHISIVLVFPTKLEFKNIKKRAVHNMNRSAWSPYARGAPGQLPSVPMGQDGTNLEMCLMTAYLETVIVVAGFV